MTGPEHYREAERLIQRAEGWENANTGWKGCLSADERQTRMGNDLRAAQVHATLAQTAATLAAAYMPESADTNAWTAIVGTTESDRPSPLAALGDALRKEHFEVDAQPGSDGSCIADGNDWPCPTMSAFYAAEAGESR